MRRNRIIAVTAGVITVVAIIFAFAADYLGLGWKWMRPAAEILLLAELVGLIVLERHQLFEPVQETVDEIKNDTAELRELLAGMAQQISASGQTTAYATSHELLRALTRLTREAFARDQETPQILRLARFAGEPTALISDPEYAGEFKAFNAALIEGMLSSRSPADAKSRWWSIRILGAVWNTRQFDFILESLVNDMFAAKPLNFEIKFLVQPGQSRNALLSPLITDREALLTFDDPAAMFRWGIRFQGRQYTLLFSRWFDEAWSQASDAHLVYSRDGLNQAAIDRIRLELGGNPEIKSGATSDAA